MTRRALSREVADCVIRMHGHGISVAGGVRLTVTRNRFFSCRDAALFLMHDLDPSAGACPTRPLAVYSVLFIGIKSCVVYWN